MVHANTYYLLKLNPPPLGVRIANRVYSTDQIRECPGNQPWRIWINYLHAGTIREDSYEGQTVFSPGTAYVSPMGCQLNQELTAPVRELGMRLSLREVPQTLTVEEVASRCIGVHEAIVPRIIEDPLTAKQVGNIILAAELAAPRGDELRSLKLRAHMYDMLIVLTQFSVDQARRQLQLQSQEWNRSTKRAVDFIQKHLAEHLTRADITKGAGCNYDHLKKVFRQDIGMTLMEYVNDQRIMKVREMLAASDISSAKAGEAVGIQDPKYLSRLFRRYTGMTITEYRNLCREGQDL